MDSSTSNSDLLSNEFLMKYDKKTSPLTPLGSFIFYRTYSRYVDKKDRRETWLETAKRSVEFNVNLERKHLEKIGYKVDEQKLRTEAEAFFDSMYNTRQFLSGRTIWVGGADNNLGEKYALANYNCSFIAIENWTDLGELFYLLMVGTGVGFKCTPSMARKLPAIRDDVQLIHAPYDPVDADRRLEHSKLVDFEERGGSKLYIGDSKEGWVEALDIFLDVLTNPEYEHIKSIKISYDSVRPRGEKLKTFGGTASGPEPLMEMFDGFDRVIKNTMDPDLTPPERTQGPYVKLRPIHILDMGNLIGNNVVVGGVRRTAEIFLMGENDYESILAKYAINGIWTKEQMKHHKDLGITLNELGVRPKWWNKLKIGDKREGLEHRRMSNNSIVYNKKPTRKLLNVIFRMMRMEGEPGFVNMEESARRRPNAAGTNPCGEILLDSYGVCNLTTVNMMKFVVKRDGQNILDIAGLMDAQRMSARAGLRMTLIDLELPKWDAVQKRDRLIGTSLTGVQDAFGAVEYDVPKQTALLRVLRDTANEEAARYAKELRVSEPLLVTTVKPEGSLSLVAGGVSSGVHATHAPYYIRRVRVSSTDPLAKVAWELGWQIHAEVGTEGDTLDEQLSNARTIVVDFPIQSNSRVFKADLDIDAQFEQYMMFQENYTDHNTSITMTVQPEEWERTEELAWQNWDNWVGAAFLAANGGTYELAPYEEITKEQYEELTAKMGLFNPGLLTKYESGQTEYDILDEECENGVCPIR